MSARRLLAIYRVVFVSLVVVASVEALAELRRAAHAHALLAIIEIIGASMLLLRRTQLVGLVRFIVLMDRALLSERSATSSARRETALCH